MSNRDPVVTGLVYALRAGTIHETVLEGQEVKDVANTGRARRVEVDRTRITTHKSVLEGEEVEDIADVGNAGRVEFARARRATAADGVGDLDGDGVDLESTEVVAESVRGVKEELDADILT